MSFRESSKELILRPIGLFHGDQRHSYDVPRQPHFAANAGKIILHPGHNYHHALEGLGGFSHIWVIYHLHKNKGWRTKTAPPRHSKERIGLFATRSPYRPNPLGMSCVRLEHIDKLTLFIKDHDLLDGTPILDIKPYVPDYDSIPEASKGWLRGEIRCTIELSQRASNQVDWLSANEVHIEPFIRIQLEHEPLSGSRKRITPEGYLAYRTWRIRYLVKEDKVEVLEILSGYTSGELSEENDRYRDKDLHRNFLKSFPPL
jgi:tRNA-Thr(GGU) m(6)t(6)A37 methyltransferase TsaA